MLNLPLFPLNTVLFPGGSLPLHIFEDRYKLMIGECIDQQSEFGVVLIKSGREVGGPAEPHPVGTTARISRVRHMDDGRINLVALGRERFRIEQISQTQPYLRADVEFLEESDGDTPASQAAAQDVATLYVEYYRLALSLTNQWQERVALPQEPPGLADFVATRIEAEQGLKQQLLETTSVADRLILERDLLSQATEMLTAQVNAARRLRYGGLGALN
jgi:Lon protease-like protein